MAHAETLRLLELAYRDFHSHPHREQDPLSIVHRYKNNQDREIAAFFAALLSYGNVKTILQSVERALLPLGPNPSHKKEAQWKGFKHRFTTGEDLEILWHWVRTALDGAGTLEAYFVSEQKDSVFELLSSFVERLANIPLPPRLEKNALRRERNLKYLLSSPRRGSACKRLNMFLRWMVRKDDSIDLGLWKKINPSQLMLPIDTHLLKTLRLLGWTRSKQATWKVVEEATLRLRAFSPDDPIRYDFALCHLSMSGNNLLNYGSKP